MSALLTWKAVRFYAGGTLLAAIILAWSGQQVPLEFLRHLLLGWLSHILDSAMMIVRDAWTYLPKALIFLGVVAVSIQGMYWATRTPRQASVGIWRWRWSVMFAGLLLVVVAGVGAGPLVVVQSQRLFRDDLMTHRGRTQNAYFSKGRHLLMALRGYAADHDGRYPATLHELVSAGWFEPDTLFKVSHIDTPGGVPVPWTYLTGAREADPADLPILVAALPETRAEQRYVVAFNGATVEVLTREHYEAVLNRWRTHHGTGAKGGTAP